MKPTQRDRQKTVKRLKEWDMTGYKESSPNQQGPNEAPPNHFESLYLNA